MGNYQDLAQRLLKNMSADTATFKRIVNDTTNPLFPTQTTLEIPLTIYQKAPTNGDISSGLASAGDVIILVSGKDFNPIIPNDPDFGAVVPKEADKVGNYTISRVISIKELNGVVALYKLVCKFR